jgi:hypothetical protein
MYSPEIRQLLTGRGLLIDTRFGQRRQFEIRAFLLEQRFLQKSRSGGIADHA